jgi:hypothetical protein
MSINTQIRAFLLERGPGVMYTLRNTQKKLIL